MALIGNEELPASGRDCRSGRSLPLSTSTAVAQAIAATAGYIVAAAEGNIFATKSCIFLDRFLASLHSVAHLFAVRALDPRPIFWSSAVSGSIGQIGSVRIPCDTAHGMKTEHREWDDVRVAHLITVAALDGGRVARLITLLGYVVFATAVLVHLSAINSKEDTLV